MAWSGGTFTRSNGSTGWQDDAAALIGITASRHDTLDNDLATGINTCLTKDGQNTPTANLPMGGYAHTGVALATAVTQYCRVSQVQDGTFQWGGTTGGTSTAYTASLYAAPAAYAAGQMFAVILHTACGATPTINFNSLGAKTIVDQDNNSIRASQIPARLILLQYDGTNFRWVGDNSSSPISYTPTTGASGSLTWNTSVNSYMYYTIEPGKKISIAGGLNATSGGTASSTLTFTLPVTAASTNFAFSCNAIENLVPIPAYAQMSSSTVINVYKASGANWSASVGITVYPQGWYIAA